MQITLYQSSAFLQNAWVRALPLWVFFDGQQIGSLKVGETKAILLPDRAGLLQVGIIKADLEFGLVNHDNLVTISDCYFSSTGYPISLADAGKWFSCGTRLWVILDIFSLCYIPYFARRMFYIRHGGN